VVIEVVGDDGEPIEEADLYLTRVPEPPSSGGSIRRPDFRPLPDGRYEAVPREPGLHRMTVRAPLHRGHRREIELAAGDNGTLRVELARVPSTDVEGVLMTAEGAPVADHELQISRLGPLPGQGTEPSEGELAPGYVQQQAVTGAEGRFAFPDIPQGRYELLARDLALGRATRQIDVAVGDDAPLMLAFPPAEGPIGRIRVRVVDPEGGAIAGAGVSVDRRPQPRRSSFRGQTDANGTCTFDALVDDADHDIRVDKEGYEDSSVQRRLDEAAIDSELIITLLPRSQGDATVVGRLVGIPPDELHRVRLTFPGYVRADGSFVMRDVPPGEHELRAFMPGYSPFEAVFTVSVPHDVATVDVGDIGVELFAVRGTVRYRDEPLTAGSVSLSPAERGRYVAGGFASLLDGRFTLPDMQAGRYHLVVSYRGWGRIHDQLIEVDRDLELDLRLGAAMASGSVVDADTGEPLGGDQLGANFVCTGCTTRSHERPGNIEVAPDGTWRAGPLEAGTWRLWLRRTGYVPWERVIEIAAGNDVELPIQLTPTPGLELAFVTEASVVPGLVRARLYDELGNEVARESFIAPYSPLPDAHWAGAPTGTWTLEAWGQYARPVRRQVTIPGPRVTVTLPVQGQVRARIPALEDTVAPAVLVVLDAGGQPVTGYTDNGLPTLEWIAPGGGEIGARYLPPGQYVARVTVDERMWEEDFELEAFATTMVTLRGTGR
jgi:hypothetical protein